jgi:carboxypeptidase Taq
LTIGAESPQLERLKVVLAEVADLSHAQQILEWDARVSMPRAGAAARAEVASTVTQLAHGRFVSDDVGKLLADLDADGHDPDSVEGALIRITRREWERARRIPSELVGEMVLASGVGVAAWDEA